MLRYSNFLQLWYSTFLVWWPTWVCFALAKLDEIGEIGRKNRIHHLKKYRKWSPALSFRATHHSRNSMIFHENDQKRVKISKIKMCSAPKQGLERKRFFWWILQFYDQEQRSRGVTFLIANFGPLTPPPISGFHVTVMLLSSESYFRFLLFWMNKMALLYGNYFITLIH